jgi:AcrR family transcriptional regulator
VPSSSATRSRREDAADTRRAILDAAEALLAEGGETALSIREVCARVGVTAPTVYHHFRDKQALVDEVVNACFAEFADALDGPDAPTDPVERLRWGFDRYVAYGLEHPAHYQLIFSRSGARPTPAGEMSYGRLRRLVLEIDAAGRLTAPVDEATPALWAAMHGCTSLLIAGFFMLTTAAVARTRDAMIAQLTRRRRESP